MPPRLSLRPVAGRTDSFRRVIATTRPQPCFFCSLSTRSIRPTPRRTRRKSLLTRRTNSTEAATTTSNPRRELEEALRELQKHAANYVNLSRVQLALSGLRQDAGNETVRVAILGLNNGAEPGSTAKEVLRVMLADPLSAEQGWERELMDHDARQPLIIRVGAEERETHEEEATLTYAKGSLLKEINVSSPGLNGNKLEILVTESNPLVDATNGAFKDFQEAALVPTVDIPTSSTRFTPITTPVHKALLVTDGIMGAASVAPLTLLRYDGTISAAVNLPGYTPEDGAAIPFATIDVKAAGEGIAAFRQSLSNAFDYERLWFQSNLPTVIDWIKSGVTTDGEGVTKEPVRKLVASILVNTLSEIQEAESTRLGSTFSSRTSTSAVPSLNKALAEWAQKAHAELQEEMDLAFTSSRWRKLNWWKLFWRVDDVGMLSSEMLSQRFLPRAERNAIYLAGRIEGSGVFDSMDKPTYSLPVIASPTGSPDASGPDATEPAPLPPTSVAGTQWPTNITFTRNYLQSETVPALQALAQQLMFQSMSTSTLSTALGALIYLSSYGISEAGAVAALGIVWSLRRLQKKWETARDYWQGEVREEGRKAVRAVELSVAKTLDNSAQGGSGQPDETAAELQRARDLVQKAENALAKLK